MKYKHCKALTKKTGMGKLILIPIFFVIVIFILFKTVFLIGYVPSASMEPTLKTDSLIFCLRVYGNIDVGDIVVFNHEGNTLVKRIAAVGGQSIEVDGVLYEVPQNYFFMLGDNSENSYDSRYWENPFVKKSDIKAKVISHK